MGAHWDYNRSVILGQSVGCYLGTLIYLRIDCKEYIDWGPIWPAVFWPDVMHGKEHYGSRQLAACHLQDISLVIKTPWLEKAFCITSLFLDFHRSSMDSHKKRVIESIGVSYVVTQMNLWKDVRYAWSFVVDQLNTKELCWDIMFQSTAMHALIRLPYHAYNGVLYLGIEILPLIYHL